MGINFKEQVRLENFKAHFSSIRNQINLVNIELELAIERRDEALNFLTNADSKLLQDLELKRSEMNILVVEVNELSKEQEEFEQRKVDADVLFEEQLRSRLSELDSLDSEIRDLRNVRNELQKILAKFTELTEEKREEVNLLIEKQNKVEIGLDNEERKKQGSISELIKKISDLREEKEQLQKDISDEKSEWDERKKYIEQREQELTEASDDIERRRIAIGLREADVQVIIKRLKKIWKELYPERELKI